MEAHEFEDYAGERLGEWIDKHLTYENGCKRDWDQEDLFDKDEVTWMFTQKGQKLFDSYVSKLTRLANKRFPNYPFWEFGSIAGVIEP